MSRNDIIGDSIASKQPTMEYEVEWTHTKPPIGIPVEILNHYGDVRRGKSDGMYIYLSDCTQPWQNAIYPHDGVIAWRLT